MHLTITRNPLVFLTFTIAIALATYCLVCNSSAATETPDYKIISTDESFEIRDYPVLTIATTPMNDGGMNGGFRQLFRFITGKNETSEKIEMTSPVLIDTAKDKKTMSFIMPKKTVEKGVPKALGENVSMGRVEASRFAVFRFTGRRTETNEKAAVEKLQVWLNAQKIAVTSEPLFAYYDPPWTPTFMRRNEVMIRIAKNHE